jgi:predicted protein tyrosine phosphatase
MVRALHHIKKQAVACGWMTARDALSPLAEWADVVVVMEPQFKAYIPVEWQKKVVVCDVGHDRWSNPYHPELTAICRTLATEKLGVSYES